MRTDVYAYSAELFTKDMANAIKVWEAAERQLYQDVLSKMIQPMRNKRGSEDTILIDSAMNFLLKGGQPSFPSNLHRLWVTMDHDQMYFNPKIYGHEPDTLVELTQQATEFRGYYPSSGMRKFNMENGLSFEEIMVNFYRADHHLIRDICNIIFPSLEVTYHKHLREDIALTRQYTLDFKFSDKILDQTGEKFKSIVKQWGSGEYRSIVDIEDSIMRSLYTFGAREGRDKGGKKDYGMWRSDANPGQGRTFTELYQAPEYRGKRKTISGKTVLPTRKILIFMFPEDGYWASFCLREITKWAAERIKKIEFINQPLDLDSGLSSMDSVTYEQFWLN